MRRELAMTASAAFAVLAARAAPAAADCTPSVELSGDADVAQEVARALSAFGVVNADVEGACRAVDVKVTRDVDGVAVTVRDPRGRIEGRVVADARTAAAWIESLVHDDAAPLWGAPVEVPPAAEPEPAPERVAVVAPPSPPSEAEVRVVAPAREARAWWRRPSLIVAGARDVASDGSEWDGVAVGACARLGPTCVGLAARHVRNGAFSDTGGLTAYDRSATSISATVALRVPVARVIVAPEAWVGVGWTTTRRLESATTCTDPTDPTGMCPDGAVPLYVGDGFAARTTAPRIGTALTAAVPLTGWLALDARGGVEAMPGAHTARHQHSFEANPFDPNITPVAPGDPLLDLPGEPGWAWTVGLGLRAELP